MRTVDNDLTGLVTDVSAAFNMPSPYGQSSIMSAPFTFAQGVQYTPMTLNRIALSYGYMGYGIVQTLIDMPVEDAFRGGIEIESDELDTEDIKQLLRVMEEMKDLEAIKNALKWARLFGGAGLLIETDDEDTRKEFNPKKLRPDSLLRFIAADRWELILSATSIMDVYKMGFHHQTQEANQVPYMYYTLPMHTSRVLKVMGKEAPSYIRLRLQGWGMSELERCMRDITAFVKFQEMIFEIVDEAKIDIMKIQQFNSMLATPQGTNLVTKRVLLNAQMKNFRSTTVMDAGDDFDQKQLNLSGYADVYAELRQNLSASVQIPEAKLFGQSSSGFSSGQDTIENYNSLVESGVRTPSKPLLNTVIDLRCQQLFGYVPEYTTGFKPLRILNGTEEEQVKTSKLNNALALFDRRLLTDKETLDSLDKDGLLNILTEVQQGLREVELPEPGQGGVDEEGGEDAEKKLDNAIGKFRDEFARRDAAIMKHFQRRSA